MEGVEAPSMRVSQTRVVSQAAKVSESWKEVNSKSERLLTGEPPVFCRRLRSTIFRRRRWETSRVARPRLALT